MPSLENNLSNAGRLSRKAAQQQLDAHATLTRWVREAVDKGWTKTKVAEVAGVSRTTVYAILNGGE
jgi:transcriptional regulator with XRE-family HTH domain